jgi:hypothetical protein
MDEKDQNVVREADLALVNATEQYLQAKPWERPQIAAQLEAARNGWAAARFRLLFPDNISTDADVQEAGRLRGRIEQAADRQQLAQALADLAGLLVKFAH